MEYEPLPDGELERVTLLEGILIGAATSGGGPMDNHTYTELELWSKVGDGVDQEGGISWG